MLAGDEIFEDVYNDVLKYLDDYKEYYFSVYSKWLNKERKFAEFLIYNFLHVNLILILEEVIKSRKFSNTSTVFDVCEYIYEEMLKQIRKNYNPLSHVEENKKIIELVKDEYPYGLSYHPLQEITSFVIHRIRDLHLVEHTFYQDIFPGVEVSEASYRVLYIIFSSTTRKDAIGLINYDVNKIYYTIITEVQQAQFEKLKKYILEKYEEIKGPFWKKIKNFFKDLINDIKSFTSKNNRNWIVITLTIGVILVVIWKLFPVIKKLVKKVFSFIKYGFLKFLNMIKRVFGLGKSEQKDNTQTLLEVYLENKHVRKLVEMKLDRIDNLLELYYSVS